jgi:hypothetical protein
MPKVASSISMPYGCPGRGDGEIGRHLGDRLVTGPGQLDRPMVELV